MQTCFNTSVLSPVVGSAVARSVWLVFRSWVRIPFFLSPKLASIFSIYCHAADELCGSDPQALIWFWESTGTVLSYCLNENGCLFYNSAAYWVLKAYSTKTIITLPLSNFWPLTIKNFKNLVQVSSPLLSPESSPWSSPESRFCSVPDCANIWLDETPPSFLPLRFFLVLVSLDLQYPMGCVVTPWCPVIQLALARLLVLWIHVVLWVVAFK